MSFDERIYKLATLAVESFGRLRKQGSDLIDQMAAIIVGGTDGSSLARKGVCKERLFQIVSVTTQVAISRRVHRYQLSLRDRQATRGRREVNGVRGGGALTRSRVFRGYAKEESCKVETSGRERGICAVSEG